MVTPQLHEAGDHNAVIFQLNETITENELYIS